MTNVRFLPHTTLGKWSAWLLLVLFLSLRGVPMLLSLFFANQAPVDSGSQIFVTVAMLSLRGLSAAGCLLTGAVAIFKYKERSILTMIATLIGLFFSLFFVGEMMFPH